jgi:nicotinate-nucleotide pyrophosphorylase (carboxylating)
MLLPPLLLPLPLALAEDLSPDGTLPADLLAADVTSAATIPPDAVLHARITAKQAGVVCGLPVAAEVFRYVDAALQIEILVSEGARVEPGTLLMRASGNGRALLAAERTALNFLGRMSGVATLTSQFVQAIEGTRAQMLDTRKTLPGFRQLDKYAVRMGGGTNHRMGLYDMAMIKDNHIDGAGGIEAAVQRVRQAKGDQFPIEVEVRNLGELRAALELPVDRIMLDNMSLADMREAVRLTGGRVPLEASGNVTLETVRAIAETGVDFISSGALTHSAPVFDVSMKIQTGD